MVFNKVIRKIIVSGAVFLLLGGCNPEMGRLPLESDVGCLRKELASDTHPSFQMAANFCQKDDHGVPLPFHLKDALDLQLQAEKANIAYTN